MDCVIGVFKWFSFVFFRVGVGVVNKFVLSGVLDLLEFELEMIGEGVVGEEELMFLDGELEDKWFVVLLFVWEERYNILYWFIFLC